MNGSPVDQFTDPGHKGGDRNADGKSGCRAHTEGGDRRHQNIHPGFSGDQTAQLYRQISRHEGAERFPHAGQCKHPVRKQLSCGDFLCIGPDHARRRSGNGHESSLPETGRNAHPDPRAGQLLGHRGNDDEIPSYGSADESADLFQYGSHQQGGKESLGHSGKPFDKNPVAQLFHFFHDNPHSVI